MADDGPAGWRVISEADSGDQVNEEGVALLSELGIPFDQGPNRQKHDTQSPFNHTASTEIVNQATYPIYLGIWINIDRQCVSQSKIHLVIS